MSRLADRIVAELPTAREEVAAMPAGPGAMLNIFARDIEERARIVSRNARMEGDADADEEPVAESGPTKYE